MGIATINVRSRSSNGLVELGSFHKSIRRGRRDSSEQILQSHLNLAHWDGCRVDDSEALPRGIGRRSRERCTCENVSARCTPRRMIKHVERFRPELHDVAFGRRYMELLMYREIDRLEVRCG